MGAPTLPHQLPAVHHLDVLESGHHKSLEQLAADAAGTHCQQPRTCHLLAAARWAAGGGREWLGEQAPWAFRDTAIRSGPTKLSGSRSIGDQQSRESWGDGRLFPVARTKFLPLTPALGRLRHTAKAATELPPPPSDLANVTLKRWTLQISLKTWRLRSSSGQSSLANVAVAVQQSGPRRAGGRPSVAAGSYRPWPELWSPASPPCFWGHCCCETVGSECGMSLRS